MKIMRILFALTGTVLAIIGLTSNDNNTIVAIMPYMLSCLGISQLIASIKHYKQSKKGCKFISFYI
ncbi:hypothetical protein GOQ27_08310 [Clostridium sp. D2Q-11]|uniref:Uncharacterized protein n=1 Tax=Anaeromonas frigoriresistens TaxID=2683708 RepID=A0A942UVV3_9FIRM|nr:hypothetical protein [Anaeromonas frigoriresistens]MBS4538465.1 hypothetical protein [Anaeromonas frigoriresistens]